MGLHGLRGNALWWAEPGNRGLLGDAWARGVPTFGLVGVDGGDNYWHPYRDGDDPLRMLLEELPGWLRAAGTRHPARARRPARRAGAGHGHLDGRGRRAASTPASGCGCAGRCVRCRRSAPACSPTGASPSRRPFAGRGDWEANDPLRFFPELAGVPTGVWCGDRDPFVDATRRYIALARPEVGAVSPGRHDGVYYARVLPDVATFLGRHARDRVAGAAAPLAWAEAGPCGAGVRPTCRGAPGARAGAGRSSGSRSP